jgi:hypothetical protein
MRIPPEGAAHSVRSHHQGVGGGTHTPQKTLAGCHVGSRSNQRDIECYVFRTAYPSTGNK